MRVVFDERVERSRCSSPPLPDTKRGDHFGMFLIQGPCGAKLKIMVTDGIEDEPELPPGAWEHVSVSTEKRPPNWVEMCFVKSLFWEDEEAVVQFHPRKSQYVNYHPNCLHLWRRREGFPEPPSWMVGPLSI